MNGRLLRTRDDHNDIARLGVSAWVAFWLHVFGAGLALVAIVVLQIPACVHLDSIPVAMAQDSEVEPSDPELAFEMEVIELPPEPPVLEPPEERVEPLATAADPEGLPTPEMAAPAPLEVIDAAPAKILGEVDDRVLGQLLAQDVGVLSALGSADAGAGDLVDVLGSGPDGAALGALVGSEVGGRGLGGLGLGSAGTSAGIGAIGTRGEGLGGLSAGGGGIGRLGTRGLGGLGTKDDAPRLRARAAIVGTTGAMATSALERAVRARLTRLARCVQDETPPGTQDVVELSLTFQGSRLTDHQVVPPDPEQPDEADHPGSERCARSTLRGLTLPPTDVEEESLAERRATLRLALTHPELDAAPAPDASSSEASPEPSQVE